MTSSHTVLTLVLAIGIPVLVLVGGVVLLMVYKRELLDWLDFKVLYAEPTKEGHGFLRSNFAPTRQEKTKENLPVKGKLPDGLNGVFLRNGPNPYFEPLGRYHWFDGDGMVHAIRIKDNKASYANRWIQTSRLKQEKAYKRPVFVKIGEMVGVKGLLSLISMNVKRIFGILDLSQGHGQANTNLVYHGKRLMALHEQDLPYYLQVLCSGAIETIERSKIEAKDGEQPFKQFTAHPKIDTETGEMHFFSYNLKEAPYLTYGVLDENGKLIKSVPIDLPSGPAMMHDMALTSKYAIFLYMPLFFRPEEMVKGEGFPFVFDPTHPSKFALLPRNATTGDEIQWFDLPAGMIFHTANAWDEGDLVHLYACSVSQYAHLGELLSSTSTKYPNLSITDGSKRVVISGAHGGMSLFSTGQSVDKAQTATGLSFTVPSKFISTSNMSTDGGDDSIRSASSPSDLETVTEEASPIESWRASVDQKYPSSTVPLSKSKKLSASFDMLNLSASEDNKCVASTTLVHFTFDTKTGQACQRKLVEQHHYGGYMLEFPIINERCLSKPNRYVYLSTFCDGMKTNGIIKVDISEGAVNQEDNGNGNVVGQAFYGEKRFGGECAFVPYLDSKEEDDGCLMSFVYDSIKKSSFLVVYDAKDMKEIAEVDIQGRVPYGFHCMFLKEHELREQLPLGEQKGVEDLKDIKVVA